MEEWKLHKSGYLVSNLGNVKSKRFFKNGIKNLKPCFNHKGYYIVNINGKTTFIHRLVVETFLSEIPNGMQVNHIDGVKTNNNINNLEIITPSENRQHAYDNKLQFGAYGEKSGHCKFKEIEIIKIYSLIDEKLSNKDIGKITGLKMSYINQIRKGEKWKYLFKQYNRIYEQQQ